MHHTSILQTLKICADVNKAYANSKNTPEKAQERQKRINKAMNNVIEKGVTQKWKTTMNPMLQEDEKLTSMKRKVLGTIQRATHVKHLEKTML